MSESCLDNAGQPIQEMGAACHHGQLTRAARLELQVTEEAAQRAGHHKRNQLTPTPGSRWAVQLDLVKRGYLYQTANGWFRITQAGRDVQRGNRCRFGELKGYQTEACVDRYGAGWLALCDSRPLSWARSSGATHSSGRFSHLCD